MMKINTLVVDDEPLAADLVSGYVAKTESLNLVGVYTDPQSALSAIAKGGVDLVFLDIQMPGLSGLSLARSLGSKAPKLVFTTAYGEYAVDGFKLDAVDYLLKPFDYEEFVRAVGKVARLLQLESAAREQAQQEAGAAADAGLSEADKYFFVKSEYKLVRIEVAKIVYIEGLKDYVKIFMEDDPKPVLTLSTLKMMESRLSSHPFVRLHRSYIVNASQISGIERSGVVVGGVKIPVGDGYKQNLSSLLEGKLL